MADDPVRRSIDRFVHHAGSAHTGGRRAPDASSLILVKYPALG
jgi:hypothetical protein